MTLREHIATHTITRLSAAAQYGAEHGRQDADMLKCGTIAVEILSVIGSPSACGLTNRRQVAACFNKLSPSL
jgi:hypothetical protein